MVEMKSDIARRARLQQASVDARENGVYIPEHSIGEQLSMMREKASKPKKRLPWFTIISVATCIPLFFVDGGIPGLPSSPAKQITPDQRLEQEVSQADQKEMATVSVTVGGKTVTREISVSDIQNMQDRLNANPQ